MVGWGRGLGTISTEVSLSLAIEALAFIHKACAFFSGHASGMSMAWGCVHGVWIVTSSFAIKSLMPFVQIFLLGRLILLFIVNSQELVPPKVYFLPFTCGCLPFVP